MDYLPILKNTAKKYGAKLKYTSKTPQARIPTKTALVPKPTTKHRFLIGLHEIGHIATETKKSAPITPKYVSEYKAEMFVRKESKRLKIKIPQRELDGQDAYIAQRYMESTSFRSGRINKKIQKHLHNSPYIKKISKSLRKK